MSVDPRTLKPAPGDRVNVTMSMVVDGAGQYRAFSMSGSLDYLISAADHHIVRVELALPAAEGALILARIDLCGVRLLQFTDIAPPFGPRCGSDMQWVVVGTQPGTVVAPYEIEPGWVQIDPVTMLPVDRRQPTATPEEDQS